MDITNQLLTLQDEKNAAFQRKLTPNINPNSFLGVRIPHARSLAKKLIKEGTYMDFLHTLPHTYYDENILHVLLISEIKDYATCLQEVETFLPYIDNWAVCDILSPKVFKKHKQELITKIYNWSSSKEPYICRFGIEMLMRHFLDDDFKSEYLEIPSTVESDEYYVNMVIAWFYATALAKQWDATIPYLSTHRLTRWTHNKTIQKAIESYRITDKQKTFLRTLK